MSVSSSRRFHTLDVVRGLAATAVVAHHTLRCTPGFSADAYWNTAASKAWWVSFLFLGDMAVTVFFVLSGASLAITQGQRKNAFAPGDFYRRRLLRIYPLYVITILVYFAVRPLMTALQGAGATDWISPPL